ncbi:GGDEF domain-containing protein [Paenibacillus sp. MMS20-IR301]|uniref:GGDEF domain-containing protein n=1 Tax=Paenibacillus sp. MMS20-IR301 TaxID=2895946 RepID=UPI0028E350EA|nr:GGDEF domain-containing protein [Paenibacillus sp. MMS20-IR301]WNS41160.1 GGDEF domain-containing protein [Paenibacillus sp. MMS20-IR301]
MEEARNYMLAIFIFGIGILTVYSILRLTRNYSKQHQRTRAVISSLVILIFSAGIGGMHILGKLSLSGFAPDNGGLFITLALYALSLAGILYLFLRVRQLLTEREQLKELAYRDTLTGLLNKNGMDHFWDHCKSSEQLAVLYLDLNRFKSINDTLGHHAGDLLLEAVGGTLQQFSRKGKRHIFRVGGDEFVVIAKRCGRKDAEQLALKVLENITRTYKLEAHELFVSASVGITTSQGRIDRKRLLKEADSAMYNAKQLGSGRYALYKQESAPPPVKLVGSTRAQ